MHLNFRKIFFIIFFCYSLSLSAQLSISVSVNKGCAPLTTAFQSSGGSYVRWNWNFGNGNTSTLQNPSAIYSSPGKYTVTLEVWDAAGTKYTLIRNQYIVVFKSPQADFQLSSSKICLGENLNLSSTSTLGDTAISKYSWDFGDGSVRSTNPLVYKYQKDGKYTISLVITDFNGCTDKKIINQAIEVLPKPKAAFTMDSAYDCEVPTVIPFRNQSTGNGITYKWSFGNGNTSTAANPRHTYTAFGTFSPKLVVTDQNGCKDSMVRKDELYLGPLKVDFKADVTSSCGPFTVNFSNVGTFNGGLKYEWDFGDGTTSSKASPSKNYYDPGYYTVKLKAISITRKCTTTVEKPQLIRVNYKPNGKISVSDSLPCGTPYTETFKYIDDKPVDKVQWYTLQDTGLKRQMFVGQTNPLTTVIFTNRPLTVKAVVTTKEGCRDSFFYRFLELPKFDYEVQGLDDGCVNFDLNLRVKNYTGNRKLQRVDWLFEDGDSFTGLIVQKSYYDTGSYPYKYRLIVEKNCVIEVKDTVHVGMKTDPDFIVDPNGGICNNEPIHFINKTKYKGIPIDSFRWSFGDPEDKWSLFKAPWAGFPPDYDESNVFRYYDQDTGKLKPFLVSYHMGCPDTAFLEDSLRIKAAYAILAQDLDFCNNNRLILSNQSSAYTDHTWYIGDDVFKDDSLILDSRGIYKVILRVEDDSTGCWDTLEYWYYPPVLSAMRINWLDFDLCAPGFVELQGQGFPDQFYWLVGKDTIRDLRDIRLTFDTAGITPVKAVLPFGKNCIIVLTDTIRMGEGLLKGFMSGSASCLPATLTFFDSTFNNKYLHYWLLSNGDTVWMTSQSVKHELKNSLKDTLTAQLFSVFGENCEGSKVQTLNVKGPGISVRSNWAHTCSTSRYLGSLGLKDPNAKYTYLWQMGDGKTYNTQTVSHSFIDSGTYTITVKVTDSAGCTAEQKVKVHYPGSRIRLRISFRIEETKCPPLIVHFRDTSQVFGGSIRKWLWDFGDSSYSVLKHPSHQYLIPGTYTVTLRVIDSLGCEHFKKFLDLIVVPGPAGTFTFDPAEGCQPHKVEFSSSVNNQTVKQEWDFGDGVVKEGSNLSHLYERPGRYIPFMIVYDSAGCKRAIQPTDTIEVFAKPEAGFTSQGNCKRDSVEIRSNSQFYGDSAAKFLWKINGLGGIKDSTLRYLMPLKTNIVSLVVESNRGCKDTLEKRVDVFQPEIQLLSQKDTICLGNDWLVRALVKADTVVQQENWIVNGGIPGETSRTLKLIPDRPQQMVIQYFVKDVMGCWDTAAKGKILSVGDTIAGMSPWFKHVSVHDNVTHELSLSEYREFDFLGYEIYGDQGQGYKRLKSNVSRKDTLFNYSPVNALKRVDCYKIASKNLCEVEQSLDVLKPHCTVELSGAPLVNASYLKWNKYVGWDVDRYILYRKNLSTGQFDSLTQVDGSETDYIDSSIVCKKNHEYRILARDKEGLNEYSWSDTCHVKPIYMNTVYAPLVRRVTVVDDEFTHLNWFRNDSNRNAMSRFLIRRLPNSGGGAMTWTLWEPQDSLVLRDLNVNVDQQSYSYLVKGIDVCEDTSVVGLLAKSILLKTRINDAYHAELSWTAYEKWRSGVKEYIIEMDRGTGFRELSRVSSSTFMFVHESQEYNCIDRIEYRIIAVPVEEGAVDSNWYFNSCSNVSSPVQKPKVYVPNAFTPNANDLNEVFKPEGIFINSYHMKIFDRWGEKLYDQKGCNQGWDGTFMGDRAPSGVYVYQLTVWGIDGSMHQFKGDVTLIR